MTSLILVTHCDDDRGVVVVVAAAAVGDDARLTVISQKGSRGVGVGQNPAT